MLLCLVGLAYSRPGYFTSEMYIGGLIGLELLVLTIWQFHQVFFAVLMYAFLSAGSDLPGGSVGTKARWFLLGVGAVVGMIIVLKERRFRFGFFHLVSLCCATSALASVAVSRYPTLAALKALSLFLLFLYTVSGGRVAVEGRENRFLGSLVTSCEILVAGIAAFYGAGIEVMGNPNSLGALMGVVGAPVLLWGTLISKDVFTRRRRAVVLFLCLYMVYYSHGRAAMLAAVISSSLLCVGLREYKLLLKGFGVVAVMIATAAILQPQAFSNSVSTFSSDVVYKGHERGCCLRANLLGTMRWPRFARTSGLGLASALQILPMTAASRSVILLRTPQLLNMAAVIWRFSYGSD